MPSAFERHVTAEREARQAWQGAEREVERAHAQGTTREIDAAELRADALREAHRKAREALVGFVLVRGAAYAPRRSDFELRA